jgi:hypothetical protein
MGTTDIARDGAIINGFRAGKRYCDLGDDYGISGQRVAQIVWKAARRLNAVDDLPDDPKPEDLRQALNNALLTQGPRRWDDVLDPHMAGAQKAWEKNQAIKRAIEAGATRRELAAFLKVSYSNVCQRLIKAERHPVSPLEHYLGEKPDRRLAVRTVHEATEAKAHERKTVYEALKANAEADARYPFDELRERLKRSDAENERLRARTLFLERALPEMQKAVEKTEAKYVEAAHALTLQKAKVGEQARFLSARMTEAALEWQRERDLNRRRVLVACIREFARILKAHKLWSPECQEYMDSVTSDPQP